MKMEHEVKLDRTKMSMIRSMCGFNLKKECRLERTVKTGTSQHGNKKGRLRWFGYMEHKDNTK